MNHENKIKIFEKIKQHIHDEKNGYCGIVWASKEIMGRDFNPKKWQIKSIASIITESGKYKSVQADHKDFYDFDISLNSESNWFKRNPIKTELFRALIAVVLAVITSIITTEIKLNNEELRNNPNNTKLNNYSTEPRPSHNEEQDNLNISKNL